MLLCVYVVVILGGCRLMIFMLFGLMFVVCSVMSVWKCDVDMNGMLIFLFFNVVMLVMFELLCVMSVLVLLMLLSI